MRRLSWLLSLPIICLLLCSCHSDPETTGYTLSANGAPTVWFEPPEGFIAVEDTDAGSDMFRHPSLGEQGYLYVGLLDGEYRELAENGRSQMCSTLAPTACTELTTDTVDGRTFAWFTMQYEFENQTGDGVCHTRIAAVYTPAEEDTILVMTNAFGATEEELCQEMQILDYAKQVVASWKTDE